MAAAPPAQARPPTPSGGRRRGRVPRDPRGQVGDGVAWAAGSVATPRQCGRRCRRDRRTCATKCGTARTAAPAAQAHPCDPRDQVRHGAAGGLCGDPPAVLPSRPARQSAGRRGRRAPADVAVQAAGLAAGDLLFPVQDMARKIGTIPCSVNQFIRIVFCLDDERKRIKDLGFESMLSLKPVKMRKNLLNYPIDLYDPVEDRVTFGSGESFTIYPYNVEIITGLKDEGTIVLLDENISPEVIIPKEYKVNSTWRVIGIRKMVRIMEYEGPPTEEFDRSFVLFLLATILAPQPMEVVPIPYYSPVRDVSKIKNMNWNAFTLQFLKDSLATLKKDHSNEWLSGNLALLQVHCNMKQKDMITPISMLSNNTEEVIHLSKRLTNVENLLTALMKKDDNLERCLEEEFNKNAYTPTSDSMEGLDENKRSGMSQATMEKHVFTRKRN